MWTWNGLIIAILNKIKINAFKKFLAALPNAANINR
jgi:hypothetical protein